MLLLYKFTENENATDNYDLSGINVLPRTDPGLYLHSFGPISQPNEPCRLTYLFGAALYKRSAKHSCHPVTARDEQRLMGHDCPII